MGRRRNQLGLLPARWDGDVANWDSGLVNGVGYVANWYVDVANSFGVLENLDGDMTTVKVTWSNITIPLGR